MASEGVAFDAKTGYTIKLIERLTKEYNYELIEEQIRFYIIEELAKPIDQDPDSININDVGTALARQIREMCLSMIVLKEVTDNAKERFDELRDALSAVDAKVDALRKELLG